MKPTYYKLALKTLVDAEGLEFPYYRFDISTEDDLEWPWMHGVALKNPPTAPLVLKVDLDDEDAGDFADFVVAPIPLVTDRFREALKASGVSNVEYYPVTMVGADQFDEFPVYCAANIVGKIAAADKAASRYTEAFSGPGATLFDKFVLDPKLNIDLQIFILAEHLSTIVVSERVKKNAESMGVDTLRFIPLGE